MSNRRKIDLIKLAAVLDKPPPLTRLPDRRVRACCKSRQGSAHLTGCTRAKDPVQLRELTPGEDAGRANQEWLDSDMIRSRVDALPDGEMTITVRVPG